MNVAGALHAGIDHFSLKAGWRPLIPSAKDTDRGRGSPSIKLAFEIVQPAVSTQQS
jgi:hypothetical protein